MFLLTREEFRDYQGDKQNFRMASFYKFGRQKFNILLDEAKDPVGGKWSFDEENRKKLPKDIEIKIIYEDSNLIIIDKKAGMVVHPGAGNYKKTLVNALLFKYKNNWNHIYRKSFSY